MDRAGKKALIESLSSALSDANIMVVAHYQGLTVAEISNLRRDARAAGVNVQVTKNTLTKLAIKETKFSGVSHLFQGPTAIAYSNDPIAAAKVFAQFAKGNEKLKIVGGAMGEQALDASGVKTLATLPSLDELRGKLIGLLQAPATKLAGVIQAPPATLARVFNAYASK